jgi:hypothetical protein
MMAELATDGGDVKTVWQRLKETDLQITEWRGTSAFAFAPTGPGAADYMQIVLGREVEWRAGPIVNPDYRPSRRRGAPPGEEELLDPTSRRDAQPDTDRLVGPVYACSIAPAAPSSTSAASSIGVGGSSARSVRPSAPRWERRVIREVGPDGTRDTPFLEAVPDWFDYVPRELRFFQDRMDSSAAAHRVFAHWALDIRDYTYKGEREIGFIPRPLQPPQERLLSMLSADNTMPDVPVHLLMDRIDAVHREVGLPFGWFFLMTHGHWVDPDVGLAIAKDLKAQRVRLPDRDAAVLLRWADRTYGF